MPVPMSTPPGGLSSEPQPQQPPFDPERSARHCIASGVADARALASLVAKVVITRNTLLRSLPSVLCTSVTIPLAALLTGVPPTSLTATAPVSNNAALASILATTPSPPTTPTSAAAAAYALPPLPSLTPQALAAALGDETVRKALLVAAKEMEGDGLAVTANGRVDAQLLSAAPMVQPTSPVGTGGHSTGTGSSMCVTLLVRQDVHVDCARSVVGCVAETFHAAIHDHMRRLFLLSPSTVAADQQWGRLAGVVRSLPPCRFGTRHDYCGACDSLCTRHGKAGTSDASSSAAALGRIAALLWPDAPPNSAAALCRLLYAPAIAYLRTLPTQRSPLAKSAALRACMSAIYVCARIEADLAYASDKGLDAAVAKLRADLNGSSGGGGGRDDSMSAIGADDLMPRLVFVLAQCGLSHPHVEASYMEECLPVEMQMGEEAYALISLRGAITMAMQEAAAAAAMQLEVPA